MKNNNLQQKNNTNVSVRINLKKNNLQKGSVLTISILVFITASTILGLGISTSILKNIQNLRGGSYSKQAYYTAEALQEDVLYRMKKNILVSNSEIMTLAGAVATSTVTDLPYGKKIAVVSDSSDYFRKIQSVVSQATGTSFAYAVQSGGGGFEMGQNSTVNGNVYSNGKIQGANKAKITGGAISASSSSGGSLISNVEVGVDAWAHTVNNSSITGVNYCVTGSGNTDASGNNKVCNIGRSDPVTQPFPISNETIASWKAEASAKGTVSGMSISGTTNHLGPKKIEGDLSLGVGGILYLDGIVWVTGDLTLGGNSLLALTSGYQGSGMIIVDGKTSILNNSVISGSGQTGSYIMILSTSSCDGAVCGAHAIDVSNNAGAVILNAQNGSVKFANNSGAKAVTANKIILDNGAVITYVVGLIETTFTTGPMGSWDIDSWQETI